MTANDAADTRVGGPCVYLDQVGGAFKRCRKVANVVQQVIVDKAHNHSHTARVHTCVRISNTRYNATCFLCKATSRSWNNASFVPLLVKALSVHESCATAFCILLFIARVLGRVATNQQYT